KLIVKGTRFQIVAGGESHSAAAIDAVTIYRFHDVAELNAHRLCWWKIETAMGTFHGIEDTRMHQLLQDLRCESLRRTGSIGDLLQTHASTIPPFHRYE